MMRRGSPSVLRTSEKAEKRVSWARRRCVKEERRVRDVRKEQSEPRMLAEAAMNQLRGG